MPKARRKPKKKATTSSATTDGETLISPGLDILSLSPLNDVSPLLLDSAVTADDKLPFKLPYVGPISLVQRPQSVVHGRGLVATRDVAAGECLFVIPAVASAPIDKIYEQFLDDDGEDYDDIDDDIDSTNKESSFVTKDGPHLESIAEAVLTEQIHALNDILNNEESVAVDKKETVLQACNLLQAFVSQMSTDEVPSTTSSEELMHILLLLSGSTNMESAHRKDLDTDTIRNTIRRNSFGPDFHNYDTIATCWNTNPDGKKFYNRMLGVYPLSAMINHSCSPNAVRIFGRIPDSNSENSELCDQIQGREVMIVHANKSISKGSEISWSYIPPSNALYERRESLMSKYGFTCNCTRCMQEEKALIDNPLTTITDYLPGNEASMLNMIEKIEGHPFSNEIRVSYATLYLEYFNAALVRSDLDKINDVLKLATRLHFSFVACNNACTEHLSILHMCYELAGVLHTNALKHKPEGAISQVRFWTEQLKRTHLVRYGNLGDNVDNVRALMKHSRVVLRKKEGWYSVNDKFI